MKQHGTCALLMLACVLGPVMGAVALTAEEEAALDQQLGILDRPWFTPLNLPGSREGLQQRAGVGGLPPYNQQVRGAQQKPDVLWQELTFVPPPPPPPKRRSRETTPPPAPKKKPRQSGGGNTTPGGTNYP